MTYQWNRSTTTALHVVLAFTLLTSLLTGTLGQIPVAAAAPVQIDSWAQFPDADDTRSGVQLDPGLYVLSDTVVIPEGATLEGLPESAWEPDRLFYDASGTLVDNVCVDDASPRTAVTICATGGGNGPGFSAFSIPSGSATISNLTITGANTNGKGGAINVGAGATLNLNDAFVFGNSADEGGGLYNAGTAIIRRSTLQANTASRKGGGIENDGTLSLVNSTLTQNVGKGGGGLSTAGTAYLSFVTVHTNESTNKIGAGTLRNGGTLTVKSSIVANNIGSDGQFHDCSGTPDFVGVNLVSSSQGCNPGAQTIDLEVEGVSLTLPGPGDFGGPTPTHPLDPNDPGAVFAIDAADSCDPLAADTYAVAPVDTDQRGRDRVDACDLGAFEVSLGIDVDLTTSIDAVEVGAVSVPLENLQPASVAAEEFGTTASTQLSAIQLSAIQLSAIQLSAIQLSAINPEVATLLTAQLSAIQLSAIQLSAILTEALQLSAIQLSAIDLSQIQLSAISQYDEGTQIDDLLCDANGTQEYCGFPLQALTFPELIAAEPGITLADIDFRSTQLSAIQLSAIVIAQLPLEVLQLSAIDTENKQLWCSALGLDETECTNLQMSDSLLELAAQSAYSDDTLDTAQLSAIQLSAIQLSAIGSLEPAQLSAIQLSAIQLSAIDWASTQLSAIQLSAIQLSAIQLSAICGTCDPSDYETLGDVAAENPELFVQAFDLFEGGTVGDLLEAFGSGPLADSDYTLADLLFGLIPSSTLAWEELGDLASLPLADAADNTGTTREGDGIKQPTFDYEITIDVQGPESLVDVGLTLPDGFTFARPDGTVEDLTVPYVRLDGVGDGTLLPTALDPSTTCLTAGDLVFLDLALSEGQYVLSVPVWAGVELGSFEASASVCAEADVQTAEAGPATASITVVEGAPSTGTVLTDNVELAHIATSGETELYQFELTGRAQARINLSNLADDLDLVLFGPPFEAPLRGEPEVGYGFVDDFAYDLTPDDDVLDPNALNDLPLEPPAGQVLHAVAARRGTADELIDTGALRPGIYTIQVSGYNGATANQAFALRLRTTPLPDVVCPGELGTLPTGGDAPVPTGINALFLYNSSTYGDAGTLQSLVSDTGWGDTGITPALIAVDLDGEVAAALNAWALTPCDPLAANDVVRMIGSSVLDPIIDANPGLEYVVIVGDDSQIPFARMTDGVFVSNEAVHGLTIAEVGQLKAALTEGFYQSDDPYGSLRGIAVADREFFVPEFAVGRLVESATEIEGTITRYLDNAGLLTDGDPSNTLAGATGDALVSGYDFLADGAQNVASALAAEFSVSPLISETWTAQDLEDALFPAVPLSLASINAHFDETRLLPANENLAGTEDDLYTVSDWLSVLEGQPYHVFSMGCHAALSVPDSIIENAVTDWAQAAAQKGSTWLGNTGYGYGDTEVVALSERLSSLYAERVGSMPIGKALVGAKQEYVSSLYTITPYDIKILEEFTLYGLPMSSVVTSAAAPLAFAPAEAATEPTVFNDPFTGLESSMYSLNYDALAVGGLTPGAWTPGYDLLTVQGRSILPQETIDVSSAGRQVAGVLVTGLESSDKLPFTPVVFDPQAGEQYTPGGETADARTRAGEITFPASIQSGVRRGIADDGTVRDRVVVVPARHYTETCEDRIEIFTDIELQTLYRPAGSPVAEPFIAQSVGRYGDDVVHFDITVEPAAGSTVERVLVLFREENASGPWLATDLAPVDGSFQWLGGRPRPDGSTATSFEYVIQAVSNLGGVRLATGKAINFDTVTPQLAQGVTVTVDQQQSGSPTFGWYGNNVIALATSESPLCSYVLDGQFNSPVPDGGIIAITGDGGHLLRVFAGNDCENPDKQGLLFVAIDGSAPESQADVAASAGNTQTVTLTAFDPFGSGVERIEYRLEGESTYTTYGGPVVVTSSTAFYFRAVDFVGNTEIEQSVPVNIDTTSPAVSAAGLTDAGSEYVSNTWTNANSVDVTVTATDDESGVASLSIDGVEVASDPLGAATLAHTVNVDTEGETTISFDATDVAGNSSTSESFTVKIDRTGPEVSVNATAGPDGATYQSDTWTNQPVNVDILATDTESGGAEVTATVNGAPATIPISLGDDGSYTIAYTATDALGNETTDTFIVKIDKTNPTATLSLSGNVLTGEEATATFSCSDDLSGVASCVVTVDGAVLSDGPTSGTVTLPSSETGSIPVVEVTVTDNAGNDFSIDDTYAVTYGYCYLYDPDKTTSGAVAVKIRITTNTYDVQCDGTEENISAKTLQVYAYQVDGGAVEPQDSGQANSDPTFEFRYDGKLKGYIYNLNTDGFTGTAPHVLDFTVGQDPTAQDPTTGEPVYPNGEGLVTYKAQFVYKA